MHLSKKLIAGAAVALAVMTGSAAYAAIPDGGGVIHGCYNKTSGQLRVTDTATNVPKACTKLENPLNWNQQGPAAAAKGTTVYEHKTWLFGGKAFDGNNVLVDSFDLPIPDVPVVPGGGPGPQVLPAYMFSAHAVVTSDTPQYIWCYLKTNSNSTVDQAGVTLNPDVPANQSAELSFIGTAAGVWHVELRCFGQDAGVGQIHITATPIDNIAFA